MWRQAWAWIRGHTIQAKIGWGFILIRGILYPSIILTMVYFFWMASLVNTIAREDARLIRIAELLDVNFLEARKAEKNFALLGDRAYLERHRESTRSLRALLNEGKGLARSERGFSDIERSLEEYLAAFEHLARQRPQGQGAGRRSAVGTHLAEYRRQVEGEMQTFRKAVRSPQAYRRFQRVLSDRLADLMANLEAVAWEGDPAIPTPLFQRLRDSGDEVQRLAIEVADRTWRELEVHREQALRLRRSALWVISIVLTATFTINTFLTYMLPRRILGPVSELAEACRRVEAGDMAVKVEEVRRDELGDLARAFNRMMEAIRTRAA